jgi:hypothetical protein
MRKISLFSVVAALILSGLGAWVAGTPRASVAVATGIQVDPFQIMMNTKDLQTVRYQDFSVVFD